MARRASSQQAHPRRSSRLFLAALVLGVWSLRLSAQQTADTVQVHDTTGGRDSITVRLAPVEVRASIAPTAGPSIGSALPARISIVSTHEINAWKPRSATDILSVEPGVSLYDDIGSPSKLNLSTRGFNVGPTVGLPSGVSVFLDGVRQNEPDAQEVNFDLLPMEHVERIEMLSGTASLLGPNSLGGAVNLVTRRGEGSGNGEVELSTDSFGAASANGSLSGSQQAAFPDYYIGAGYDRDRGWRDATNARNYNVFVNIRRHDASRAITMQAYAARSRAQTAGSLPESVFDVSPKTNFTEGDFDDLYATQLSLSGYAPLASGRGSFTAYLRHSGGQRFNVNQPPDDNVRSRDSNGSVGANADWRRAFALGSGALAFRAGLDGAANRVDVRIFSNPERDPQNDVLTTDVRSPSWDIAAYSIADARFGRATLSGGARYDYVRVPFHNSLDPSNDTTSSFQRLSPRAGLSVDLGKGALAYVSVGQSFRAPAILELGCADPTATCPLPFALGDDPPLKPVRATTYEIGARWAPVGVFLDASLYRTDVRDEIFFVAAENALLSGFFTNISRTRREGAELSARYSFADDRVFTYANYTYTRATFQTATTIFSIRADPSFASSSLAGPNDVLAGDRIPLTPDHQLKGGALLKISPRLDLGLDARYIGRQWLRGDEANETRPLESYVVTNARVGFHDRGWEVTLLGENIFDAHSATFGTFNENRQTGNLERFLTPLTARTLRLVVRRGFGRQSTD